jgi:hypothetical protein
VLPLSESGHLFGDVPKEKARHFFSEWTSKFQAVSCSVNSGKLHGTLEFKVAWTLEE